MKRMKKLLAAVLLMSLLTSLLTGCSSAGKQTNEEPTTMKVTDLLGREVEVPTKINSIIALGAGGLRMICYAGKQDMIVGVEEGETTKTLAKGYNFVNFDKFKDLPIVGQGGSGSYTSYQEEILKCNPDVIFAAYTQDLADDLQNKTGIPVVVINYDNGMFDEKLYQSMELIGDLLDCQSRCTELVDYLKQCNEDLTARTKDIADAGKPSVYTGAVSFKGSHGMEGTYVNYPPFSAIGAKSVSDELGTKTGGVTIDLEKLAVWNPDYIFVDPNNISYVKKDYKENKNFFDSLKAVQEGKVYSQVAYNWYTSNIETALIDTYYAGMVLYPDKFNDINIEKIANEIYVKFLGNQASSYYKDMAEGGLEWKQIKIGE